MEAEAVYDTLIERGESKESAIKKAEEVFLKGLSLFGLDGVQLSIALIPFKIKGTLGSIVTNIAKTAIGGLTEGYEESFQTTVSKNALREDGTEKSTVLNNILNDRETQESFFLGSVIGISYNYWRASK